MPRAVRLVAALIVVLSSACAEPPNKEMDQAQGALDAARAAGADRFASEEFSAATDALARAQDAVAARDYRQALSLALDSRERAQNAAKLAVEGRANARGQAERSIAEVATLLAHAQERLRRPETARLSRRTLRRPHDTVAASEEVLQEARSALAKEDYAGVNRALGSTMSELQAALRQLDAALVPAPVRRPR
jgi:hypothetical protein